MIGRLIRGVARRAGRWFPRGPRPAILMYHRIAEDAFDPWGLAVEQAQFAQQLDWLAANRTVMPLSEFARRQRDGRLPPDAVALTFDDGYSVALKFALPLLERRGLSATMFLPAELIERGREFWWDELAQIVLDFGGRSLRLNGEQIAMSARNDRDHVWPPNRPPTTSRQKLFHSLWVKLRTLPPAKLDAAMDELRRQGPTNTRDAYRPLGPKELRAASSAIEFGSHALTHPSLPLLDAKEKRREISDSYSRCKALTGKPPAAFAYPYGDFDAESIGLVEQAGFVCACTTMAGFVGRRSHAFALPRLQVGNWDAGRLSDMLAGQW